MPALDVFRFLQVLVECRFCPLFGFGVRRDLVVLSRAGSSVGADRGERGEQTIQRTDSFNTWEIKKGILQQY